MESGIYKIINIITNKFYLGSAKNLTKRWQRHLNALTKDKHENIYLQRAFKKYGKENFRFEIIEYCEIKDLLIREQYYLDYLTPWDTTKGYNIGRKSSGGDNLSSNPNKEQIISNIKNTINETMATMTDEEKKAKWGRPQETNPNWKGGISKYECVDCKKVISYGYTRCLVCSKIGENNSFYGKKHTEETKEKIRLANLGKQNTTQAKSVIINGIFFRTQTLAAEHFNVSVGTITNWVLGRSKRKGIIITKQQSEP